MRYVHKALMHGTIGRQEKKKYMRRVSVTAVYQVVYCRKQMHSNRPFSRTMQANWHRQSKKLLSNVTVEGTNIRLKM